MSGAAAVPSGVFTIPPGVPFVDALARGLLDAADGAPTGLAPVTVLLPNRRACRALADAFLGHSPAGALLLPAIAPIGDVDDDEALSGEDMDGAATLAIPPAVPELRRQLLLTRLIRANPGEAGVTDAAQAARLARELAGLLDQVATERIGFEHLDTLVPADLAAHWQITLGFLRLLTEHWPAILDGEGALDPADRRNRLIDRRIAAWRADPPSGPVVIAGSTGSIPATRDLMACVAGLATGAIVLPGLDRDLDEAGRANLDPGHPQYGLEQVLERLRLRPGEVRVWPGAEPGPGAAGRARLIAASMRPARGPAITLDPATTEQATRGVTRIDCAGPREEAATIALLLREVLEDHGKTAALVTPDRGLARRVAAELRRWDIEIDDSAGQRLDLVSTGSFLRLTARLVAESWAPVPLLAALKHPFAAGSIDRAAFRARVRALERRVLRGPRPGPGAEGLLTALHEAKAPAGLVTWIEGVRDMLAPLDRLLGAGGGASIGALVAAHVAVVEALAATADTAGSERLWAGEAGEAAAGFMSELAQAGHDFGTLAGHAWPDLLETLMRRQVLRPRYGRHPRLNIWGVLEARLLGADRLILGGLNEGTWPAEPSPDPWMSRPMRTAFGLPPHERRIGLAAHDFSQAFAAPELFLTRASRVAGTPTVPSRWLLRLENAVAGAAIDLHRAAAAPIAWQTTLDRPAETVQIRAPAPVPPVAVRPRRLSVTQVETLIRDPYAVYARHILDLRALDPIDADPGAAEQGTFVHHALDAFLRAYPENLPDDALAHLLAIGRTKLGAMADRPGVRAFWWPRFERVADWFLAHERGRRPDIERSLTEIKGSLEFEAPAGRFTLNATADRIDVLADGTIAIVDYKTGTLPTKRDIEDGASPQLPLEAAIASAGGFAAIAPAAVADLAYWRLGGGDPPGEIVAIAGGDSDLAARTLAGLEALIAAYDDPETPYWPQPDPRLAPRYSDYVHLERLAEYSPDRARMGRR